MQFALTYYSIGRLAPALLTLAISIYLYIKRDSSNKSQSWIFWYFVFLTIFNFAYLFGYSVNHEAAGFAWYGACIILLAAVARLQIAYVFPGILFKKECTTVLYISLFLAGAGVLEYFLQAGTNFQPNFNIHSYGSHYRSMVVPGISFLFFVGSIVVSVRAAVYYYRKTTKTGLKPGQAAPNFRTILRTDKNFKTALGLAVITICETYVNSIFILNQAQLVSTEYTAVVLNIVITIGILLFLNTAIAATRAGYMHRLVGLSLVTILTVLSIVSFFLNDRETFRIYSEKQIYAKKVIDSADFENAPDMIFLGENDSYNTSRPGLKKTSFAPVFAEATRGAYFRFARMDKDDYYAFRLTITGRDWFVIGPYADYRQWIHESNKVWLYIFLASAVFVSLFFPWFFRDSLQLPLQSLLSDLQAIRQTKETPDGDEISYLRNSFTEMTQLLREAQEKIPAYKIHLEEVEISAALDTQSIEVDEHNVFVVRSPRMVRVLEYVNQLKKYNQPVLITGETGTGKELVAKLLHSKDSTKPFIAINCASLPESLWESEIFGFKKGAFTGADKDFDGKLAQAADGTLFFDEVGEMPLAIQSKLLRVLQERTFTRLGDDALNEIHCRFVFATNRDLNSEVEAGRFRSDLHYRIGVFPVELPALSERLDDIPELSRYFVEEYSFGPNKVKLSNAGLRLLMKRQWPGNVRQLQSVILRALSRLEGDVLEAEHFDFGETESVSGNEISSGGAIEFEKELRRHATNMIKRSLEITGGNKTQAAKLLGLKRTTLRNRMRDLGIDL